MKVDRFDVTTSSILEYQQINENFQTVHSWGTVCFSIFSNSFDNFLQFLHVAWRAFGRKRFLTMLPVNLAITQLTKHFS